MITAVRPCAVLAVAAALVLSGTATASAEPARRGKANVDVTMHLSPDNSPLRGKVRSPRGACEKQRRVVLLRRQDSTQAWHPVDEDRSNRDGRWRIEAPTMDGFPDGEYRVKVPGNDDCRRARSGVIGLVTVP
jgi:hypothetical protein